MKRMTALILCAVLLLSLAACGESGKPEESTPPSGSTSTADDPTAPSEEAPPASGSITTPEDSAAPSEEAPPVSGGAASAPEDSSTPDKRPPRPDVELTPAQMDSELTDAELYELWEYYLVGWWTATERQFAIPDMEDSHTAVFGYGLWETEGGRSYGRVTELTATGEQELTAQVTWPATEATELTDALKELTLTVIFDYSGAEQDGKIRIKIGENDWYQYMFAGMTQEEAYQTYCENTYGTSEPPDQSGTKIFDVELYERWGHYLVGYWFAAEDQFALPDMEDNHTAVFTYGLWGDDAEPDFGRVTELTATGEQELTARVTWPATAEDDALTVIFDYSGLEQDGKIRIKIGDDDWQQYMFAGMTREEANQTYLENTNG